jgi:hypothetical protein
MDEISKLSEASERNVGKNLSIGRRKGERAVGTSEPSLRIPSKTGPADEIDRAASTAYGFVANISSLPDLIHRSLVEWGLRASGLCDSC